MHMLELASPPLLLVPISSDILSKHLYEEDSRDSVEQLLRRDYHEYVGGA